MRSSMPQKQPPARTAVSVPGVRVISPVSKGPLVICVLLVLGGEEVTVGAVALVVERCDGHEAQCGRVHAVSQAAGIPWAVGEDVTEVAIGARRAHLGAGH